MKYIIKSNKLQSGKWQPAYLPPPMISEGQSIFSEETEFVKERFNSKQESDNFVFDFLIKGAFLKMK